MTMFLNRTKQISGVLFAAVFVLSVFLFAVTPAFAHERVEVDSYVLIFGWLNEPVVVGERNAILVQITEDDAPVEGLVNSLKIELTYAGRTFKGNLFPGEKPGTYLVELIPTVRGQYEVHLTGTINGTDIDINVEPEEVLTAAVLQFPEAVDSGYDLETDLKALEHQLAQTRTYAWVGVGFGVLGVGLAVFSLTKKR